MSTGLIGRWFDTRLACDEAGHVLATGNPWERATWCICGQVRVPWETTEHSVWRERFVYDGAGQGAKLLGFDRFLIEVCACHKDGMVADAHAV